MNLSILFRVFFTNAIRLACWVHAVNSAFKHALDLHNRALVVLATIKDPSSAGNEKNDAKGDDSVVHVGSCDGDDRREHKQDGGKDGPADSNNVAGPAKPVGKLERAALGKHLAASQDVDERWDGIGNTKRNNGRGSDGVEGAGRAQENAAENNNPGGCPKQGVDGDIKGRVNPGEDVAERHSSVSGKGVAHSGTGGDQSHGGEKHAHEREHEQANTAGPALGRVHEDMKQRALSSFDDTIDVGDDKHEATEEDETGEHADADAIHHNLGALLLRIRNLFDHVRNPVEAYW